MPSATSSSGQNRMWMAAPRTLMATMAITTRAMMANIAMNLQQLQSCAYHFRLPPPRPAGYGEYPQSDPQIERIRLRARAGAAFDTANTVIRLPLAGADLDHEGAEWGQLEVDRQHAVGQGRGCSGHLGRRTERQL